MAVCSLDYIGKTYSISEIDYVSKLHEQVENDFRTMGSSILRASNEFNRFVPINLRNTKDLNRIRQIRSVINNYYGEEVIIFDRDSRGMDYYVVNVNPLAQKNLFFQKDALHKMSTDNYRMNEEGDIVPNIPDGYEKRMHNMSSSTDSINEYMSKIQKMQKIFDDKGVDVYVLMDGDLKNPGEVLGKNNTIRKTLESDGTINPSTAVVALNPRMAFDDVVFHEFGHLMVDLIGGMNNPMVSNAYLQLKNSDAYNTVKELYPELNENSEKFQKEVVVTALGYKADNLFKNDQNKKTRWQRFVDWVGKRLNALLGIQPDSVTELANQLLTGSFNVSNTLDVTAYQKKSNGNVKKIFNDRIKDLQTAKEEIQKNINSIVKAYEKRAGEAPLIELSDTFGDYNQMRKKEDKISLEKFNVGQMKAIQRNLKYLNDVIDEETLIAYVTVATNSINRNKRQLERIQNEIDKGELTKPVLERNLKFLQSINISNQSFDLLNKLEVALKSLPINNEVKTTIAEMIRQAATDRNTTTNLFREVGIQLLAERLAPLEDLVNAERKEEFELEYKQGKNDPLSDVKADETQDEYIRRKMESVKEETFEDTKEWLKENLYKSLIDVGNLELLIRSEKAMNSMVIRLASKILDGASFRRDKNFLKLRDTATNLFKEFYEKNGKVNPKEMWKDYLQEYNGGLYLTSEYDIEFYKQFQEEKEKIDKARNDFDNDKISFKEYQEAENKYTKWKNDNTTQVKSNNGTFNTTIPKEKWKSKKYQDLMKNPNSVEARMLKFLENTIKLNDSNYQNQLRLTRTPFGQYSESSAKYYRLPSINRDGIEKAVSGDYKANAIDTVERLFVYKADDTERGSLQGADTLLDTATEDGFDPRLMKKVMSDSIGFEKHNIPIMFRGPMDIKTTSYDVMSAVMMDAYFSMNYAEKSLVQGDLEILLQLTAMKTVHPSSGMKNLLSVYNISETELDAVQQGVNSNEFKKLQSIIENRLFGITTKDSEYAKIAQTMMAWTGSVMMSLNFFSGIANVMQGKVMNWLESKGGQYYSQSDLVEAEKKFWADSTYWMDDIGQLTNKSKTRFLLDLLNVQGDFVGLNERYTKSNRGLALAQSKTLAAPNHMGEFYVQSTLMYAMMNKIKVMDKNGNYLDENFNPTKDKNKAISLDNAITVKDGRIEIHPNVYKTTFSDTAEGNHDKILEETRSYIKKVSSDLHGQYDTDLQTHAQRSFWGKFPFMFRKWLVPGFDRRWRGTANVIGKEYVDFDIMRSEDARQQRYFSSDLKSFQEGTYTTLIRTLRQLNKEGESMIKVLTGLEGTNTWSKMTDNDLSNVRKAVTEIAVIIATLASAYILRGLAEELPEDSPERNATLLATFAFRRLHMELAAFANPLEAIALLRSPAASISLLEKSGRLGVQLIKDLKGTLTGEGFETYERGAMKDQYKIKKYTFDLLPVANQTNRSITDVTTFVFQMY